jgi:hypothetical protein
MRTPALSRTLFGALGSIYFHESGPDGIASARTKIIRYDEEHQVAVFDGGSTPSGEFFYDPPRLDAGGRSYSCEPVDA